MYCIVYCCNVMYSIVRCYVILCIVLYCLLLYCMEYYIYKNTSWREKAPILYRFYYKFVFHKVHRLYVGVSKKFRSAFIIRIRYGIRFQLSEFSDIRYEKPDIRSGFFKTGSDTNDILWNRISVSDPVSLFLPLLPKILNINFWCWNFRWIWS